MVPPPQGQMPQSYYGYPQQPPTRAAPVLQNLLTKRILFLVVGIGGFLVWISEMSLNAFSVADPGARNLLQAVGSTGAFLGFGGSLLGGLGSPRTDATQNVGLLVLAGFFLFVLVFGTF